MTELDLCNLVVAKLGLTALDSMEDKDNPHLSTLIGLLPSQHASLLSRRDWGFAIFTDDLAPLTTLREGKRLTPVPKSLKRAISPQGLRVLDGCIIFPNEANVLRLTYLKQVEIDDLPPLYAEALACKLAVEMCTRVGGTELYRERLKADFELAFNHAIYEDLAQGKQVFHE